MAEVRLENITKIYPGNEEYTVKETSLTIKDKEFVVLVGPSGCGKSTMLRMVAGLEDISSGELIIDEKVMNDVQPKDRDIAMVFQNYALYPHMTVAENISFSLRLKKVPKDVIDQKVKEVSSMLGLDELLQRKPKAMSGGQRQRVALGRAIIREPKVFLMDEPLSNLDAKLRGQMRAEILKIHQKIQNTVIYVTHDQVEAMTMGDRIVILNGGVIQQVDTPTEVYNNPSNKFVAGFMGSPPMNFLNVTLEVQGDELYLKGKGEEDFSMHVSPKKVTDKLKSLVGRELTLGIRPEDIYDKSNLKAQDMQDSSILAKVDIVEPLGAELYVHLKVGSNAMVGRVAANVVANPGDSFQAFIDPEKIHIFHPDTEERVSV
ncbi:MAG: sn-glycerol-3-phosphate ABC transporter ATP-binding protein UgpC [Candidatus Cloacimonetes bacterium]|nr:sn-glycerol-3-phosphate ABC transporter ATP-binding protein UgpC [Candidatus Cloacimonadota bacterium]